jgi:ribonucleoside-diphosphate reductase alpha chain
MKNEIQQKADFKLPVKRVTGDSVEERLTENAHDRILPSRYLLKDEEGNTTETPKEMFERVAKNVAQPDKEHDDVDYEESWQEFFDLMSNLAFMPNSPTLMNAGAELQQLSACFVVHPEDDMDSIFSKVHDAAKIFQSGGGMGYPFHLMRPKGDIVSSTGGVSSGPMSFQQVFDTMCGTIKQGGKRRGAQMGIMKIDHPDVLRFITSKRKEGNLSNFNISVGLTEDFMEAVKNDEEYTLYNPRTGEPFKVKEMTAQFYNRDEEWYPEAAGSDQGKDDNFWRDHAASFGDEIEEFDIDLEPGEEMTLPARFIWETLIDGAWRNGEPGLFMYDETNDMHSFDIEEHPEHKIEATNPCGEQPLENYEACNLGHINLSVLVEDNSGEGDALSFPEWKKENQSRYDFEDEADLEAAVKEYLPQAIDMDRFEYVAKTGTRFLDNVVTMSDFPLQEIEDTVSSQRKIGLGLMGFAQMLIQLGVRYGSDESVAIAKEIQRLITRFSIEASHELAEDRGEFSEWEKSKWADPTEYPDWFRQYTGGLDPEEYEDGLKLRNHNTTTIAPTGTTSMIGNTSGGCEPIYSLAYFKNVAKDIQGEDMLVEFDDYFIRALEENDVDVEKVKEDAQQKMENNEWEGVESIDDEILPPHVKEMFATADQVTAKEHIDIQAAFQHYNHSGISKTCNFPNEATKEDVREAYMRAYDKGIKGMTVYRDGTRETQVMQTNKDNELTDMDKVDMLSEIVEEFGGAKELLQSNEFEEVVSQTELQVEEEDQRELAKEASAEVTQEGIEADSAPESEKHTEMGKKEGVKERPKVAEGTTHEIETAYGDLFVTVNNSKHNGPVEVFARIGKAGGYTQSFTEALGRTVSLALRSGAEADEVIKQLDDIRSPQISWDEGQQIHSVPDAVAEAMKRHMQGGTSNQQTVDQYEQPATTTPDTADGELQPKTETEEKADEADAQAIVADGDNPECPDCGGMLVLQEGCKKCPDCGWSKC